MAARSAESGMGNCVLLLWARSLLSVATRKMTCQVTVWAVITDREHSHIYTYMGGAGLDMFGAWVNPARDCIDSVPFPPRPPWSAA